MRDMLISRSLLMLQHMKAYIIEDRMSDAQPMLTRSLAVYR